MEITINAVGLKDDLPGELTSYLDEHRGLFLFDVDGILADTESLHWEAYILSRQGIKLSHGDILKYIGNPGIAIYDMIRSDYGARIDGKAFMEERLARFLELVEQRDLKPFEFVLLLLGRYKEVPKALVTPQRPEIVDTLIGRWQLGKHFPKEVRLSCSENTFAKSDVYKSPWKHLNQFEQVDSDSVVVFEDSLHAIKAAEQAGLGTVYIRNSMNEAQNG